MRFQLAMYVCAVYIFIFLTHQTDADDVIIQKRVSDSDLAAIFDPKHKKPFCNAFTGCGKKRSDESLATLVELNSEPAVEELSRQILSEAKLWEAIQEARAELLRRRSAQQQQPLQIDKIPQKPFSLASLKKRSVDYLES